MTTLAARLADALVTETSGYPLIDWIADHRDAGHSWEQISKAFEAQYGVTITAKNFERWVKNVGRAGRPS